MFLAADIGNTTISLGVFRDERLVCRWHAPSAKHRTAGEHGAALRDGLARGRIDAGALRGVAICSVVPETLRRFVAALDAVAPGARRSIVGEDVVVPLANRYRAPEQVGQDRLVNAYAALAAYQQSTIVVDFGTAITVDVVTADGAYLGGAIAPGVEISLEALAERTALLPRVALDAPGHVIGGDTQESIRSGLVYGFAALVDGLVTRMQQTLEPPVRVVATGGYASMITTHCHTVHCIDQDLTLTGLCRLWMFHGSTAAGGSASS